MFQDETFNEAGKVKSSTSLSQKCKIMANNICEHRSLVRPIVFSEIVRFSVNHREDSFSVLPGDGVLVDSGNGVLRPGFSIIRQNSDIT